MFVSLGNACVDRVRTGEWQRPGFSSLLKGLVAVAECALIGVALHAGLSHHSISPCVEMAGAIEGVTLTSIIASRWLCPSEKKGSEPSQEEKQKQQQRDYAMTNRNTLLTLARSPEGQTKESALVHLRLIYTEAQLQKLFDLPPAYSG